MQVEPRNSADAPELDRLLEALPKETPADPAARELAQLITRISNSKVPTTSFVRGWTLGSLQAKVAFGYLAYWLRSRFADADEKQRLKNEAHLAAALKLFGTMGYLRGAVMKVGQLLANLPEVVPEQFAEVLSALHFEAPPMHFAMVREVFWDEFGREPEEIFACFDRQAFAAASLGQVHRATLHSGEEVAVKIQYPGIARTIKSDLRNLRLLLQPLCLTRGRQDLLDKLADIERMLLMETDYQQEAAFGEAARALFVEEDQVVVPRVFEQYSSKRVLTTEFLAGRHLDEFLASSPSQQELDRYTSVLTVGTFRIYYRLHWFLADPHPGNFIFMNDGRLGLIDFGCTRVMTDDEWLLISDLEKAHQAGDRRRFDQNIAKACYFDDPSEMDPEQLEILRRSVLWNMEPWLKEGLFDFGDRDFFLRGIDGFLEMTRKRCTQGSPLYLWSTRFIFGGRAVCYRMKGRCEFGKIFRQESAWLETSDLSAGNEKEID
jgi:aarF domain-containing kinase